MHPVSQSASHDFRIVGEARGEIAIGPAARILELLRKIPMIEREHRPNAGSEQLVHQPAVKIQPLGIRLARAFRLDACRRHGKPVAVEVQRAHQRNIFAIAMIVIAGDVTVRAVLDLARSVRETVPNGFALAVLVPCALDLKRGRGGAPIEIFGETDFR